VRKDSKRHAVVTAAVILVAAVAAPACLKAPARPVSSQGAAAAVAAAEEVEVEPDPILARGQHSTLTRDNAVAFYESLVFSLAQVGHDVTAARVSPERVIGELAALYDGASRDDQIALARWRRAWTAMQARWSELSTADQRAFVRVVLVASFGEQTAGQLVGMSMVASTAPAAHRVDDDSLTPSFDDPDSDCWSSSGCHLGRWL
jgi:hypothetical protein